MKNLSTRKLLSTACVAALGTVYSGTASAQLDPYAASASYGIQWNFLNGSSLSGADSAIDAQASSDGSVWIVDGHNGNGGGDNPWGQAKTGGSWDSGVAHITANGVLAFGTGIPQIPDHINENQNYIRGGLQLNGTTAYVVWSPGSSSATWSGLPAGGSGQPMTVSIDPTNSYAFGNKYNVPAPTSDAFSRNQSAYVTGTGDIFFSGGYQLSPGNDAVTNGDGSLPVGSPSYSPYLGMLSADGSTIMGPTKQGNTDGRSYFDDLAVNETTGDIFAVGFTYNASGGNPTYWDVNGDGTADHNFAAAGSGSNNSRGIIAKYDSSFNVVASTVWETAATNEWAFDVITTQDGGILVAGRTQGDYDGAVNPDGNFDTLLVKYDANLNEVWNYQSGLAGTDNADNVIQTDDGNILIGITAAAQLGGTNQDAVVVQLDSAGNLIRQITLDNNDSQENLAAVAAVDKDGLFVYSTHNSLVGDAWDNVYSYVAQDNNELLVQKVTPGDTTLDGYVNLDDLDAVGLDVLDGVGTNTAVADFVSDGQITKADYDYFVANVFDTVQGDANLNGGYDVTDIDIVNKAAYANSQAAGAYRAIQDMDWDGGNTDTADRDAWLATAGAAAGFVSAFGVGDSDLNGKVEFTDFVSLSNNYSGATTGQTWSTGDFDGDGDVAFGDFVLLSNNWAYDANAVPAAADVASAVTAGEAKLIVGADGSLTIEGGNVDLNGYSITSASGKLIADGDNNASPFTFYISNTATDVTAGNLGTFANVDGLLVLDASVNPADLQSLDLVFEYGTAAGSQTGVVEVVPEPTSLALLGLGGLLLARRRRD